jgi:hypothetical protein
VPVEPRDIQRLAIPERRRKRPFGRFITVSNAGVYSNGADPAGEINVTAAPDSKYSPNPRVWCQREDQRPA